MEYPRYTVCLEKNVLDQFSELQILIYPLKHMKCYSTVGVRNPVGCDSLAASHFLGFNKVSLTKLWG